MKGFVYVLISKRDNKKYIGSTVDLQRRLCQHNKGLATSTKYRRPLELLYVLEYPNIKLAALMEKKFKRSHDLLLRELESRGIVQR